MSHFQHESAIVDDGAEIGDGSRMRVLVHVAPSLAWDETWSWATMCLSEAARSSATTCKIQNNVSIFGSAR
jgi:UDP-2-acetamido-3-amino-2,3-dideoxy-glucuronate N-acetyltransferase